MQMFIFKYHPPAAELAFQWRRIFGRVFNSTYSVMIPTKVPRVEEFMVTHEYVLNAACAWITG
jgi:hypothetical protein